jgi:hypothetical protein
VRGEIMRTVFSWRNKQADDIKKHIKENACQNRRWRELALNRVQWWALVFAVLNVRVVPVVTEPPETDSTL